MNHARSDITIAEIAGKHPRIHSSAFIAPGCRIVGDVEIGPDSSVWYNCVIRGDANRIVIGARTNIQDGTIVHCDSPKSKRPEGFPTIIRFSRNGQLILTGGGRGGRRAQPHRDQFFANNGVPVLPLQPPHCFGRGAV